MSTKEMNEAQKDIKENLDPEEKEAVQAETANETTDNSNEAQVNEEKSSNALKELTEKYDCLNDSYLRLRAEYENYRKRTLKEKSELIRNGGETALTNILPVIDDFERALDVIRKSDSEKSLVDGVELIYSKFMAYLKQNGVKQMETIGQAFDSEFHEAVTTIPAPKEEMKGKIIDCIQQGYFLNEKVIRFAKVIVGE